MRHPRARGWSQTGALEWNAAMGGQGLNIPFFRLRAQCGDRLPGPDWSWQRSKQGRAGALASSRHRSDASEFVQFRPAQPGFPLAAPSIGGSIGGECKIWAKCWSEWQDLNLRPPRPERGDSSPAPCNLGNFCDVRATFVSFVHGVSVPVSVPVTGQPLRPPRAGNQDDGARRRARASRPSSRGSPPPAIVRRRPASPRSPPCAAAHAG